MANTKQVIIDSHRLYTVKLTSNAGEGQHTIIDAGGLNFSLNSNGGILIATTGDRKPFYRLDLMKAFFIVNSGLQNPGYVRLYWESANNITDLLTLTSTGTLAFIEGEVTCTLNNNSLIVDSSGNPHGNVGLETIGFGSSNSSYSLVLTFRKNPQDYDQGQSADPTAFNRGPAAGYKM